MELMDCAETYSATIVLKLQVALSIAVTLGGELKLPSTSKTVYMRLTYPHFAMKHKLLVF
jgi:hypothetical protein